MNLKKILPKRNFGMALPLTLIFLLVGAVLVGTALYVVENMFSTSRHVVTETQLYNAAQSGIEQGKKVLWENRENLDLEEREYIQAEDLDSIRARVKDETNAYLDDDLKELTVDGLPHVIVNVDILDCNYRLSSGQDFTNLQEDERKKLPPQYLAKSMEADGGSTYGLPEGTSAIIDPSRRPLGGGLSEKFAFVIRSTANAGNGVQMTIETMLLMKK